MLFLVVISLLSSAVAADFGSSPSLRDVPDGSNTTTAATAVEVIGLVRQTLRDASTGIVPENLFVAATRISFAAKSYLRANGTVKVPRGDVKTLIKEVAAERNVTLVESSRGRGRVILRAQSLSDALTLLDGLASRAQTVQDAGQSPRVAIAAIDKIAKAIQWFAFSSDDTVTYGGDSVSGTSTKRRVADLENAEDVHCHCHC